MKRNSRPAGQSATERVRISVILDRLASEYPDRRPLLVYDDPFQLMVSVSLSAQTTDAAVNRVTPDLFSRWPDPRTLADAHVAELEEVIHPLGYFRQKARNLIGAAQVLNHRFGGILPSAMDDLLTLPGIGRKSANVIRSHLWDFPGIIVDTHFGRVCRRLGLTLQNNPDRVEQEVGSKVPMDRWNEFSMTANLHGRRYCHARKPLCTGCPLTSVCPRIGIPDQKKP